MLGSRTKQVNSYGKRHQRIVNVSENNKRHLQNTLDEVPAVPSAPIVSKMKTRGQVQLKSTAGNLTVHINRKKRTSSALTPPQIMKFIRRKKTSNSGQYSLGLSTPSRTPLAPVSLNTPGSPAFHAQKQTRMSGARPNPFGSKNLTTPILDVEIITLDDSGKTLRQERRASRPNVISNPINERALKPSARRSSLNSMISNNEDNHHKPLKRPAKRVVLTVNSDDSDSSSDNDEQRTHLLQSTPKPFHHTSHASKERVSKRPVRRSSLNSIISNNEDKPLKRPAKRAVLTVYSDDSNCSSDSDEQPTHLVQSTPKPSHHITLHASKTRPSNSMVEIITPASYSMQNIDHESLKTPITPAALHSSIPETANSSLVINCESPSIPDEQPSAIVSFKRYQRHASPMPRARRLTPIRRGGKNRFHSPSPSPSITSTDFDLSLHLDSLNVTVSPDLHAKMSQNHVPIHLEPLLAECGQSDCGPIEFSSFIDTFPYDPIVRLDERLLASLQFRKIGEASYSEVFGIGDVVLKVIPLRNEEEPLNFQAGALAPKSYHSEGGEDTPEDVPALTDAKDVLKEILVTHAMGEMCNGFVNLLKAYVVRGKYPEVLLQLWDEYYASKGSESVRPDKFLVSQIYTIIVLPNGGPDLEAYKFINAKVVWRQACSIFWQVAKSLAHAEQLVSFEHRDLHVGQILVRDLPTSETQPLRERNQNVTSKSKASRIYMDDAVYGVRTTLIDLGLSRMDAGDGRGGEMVHWTPFEEEIFMGEGDYQFDIYRMMREHNGGAWEEFKPLTNVMWLHYLAIKLTKSKRLKLPPASRSPKNAETGAFSEKDCYDCLIDVEYWLRQSVNGFTSSMKQAKGKSRKKALASSGKLESSSGPVCASEIILYAAKKGWLKAPI